MSINKSNKPDKVVNGCLLFFILFTFFLDRFVEKLGSGSFGKVHKAIHLKTGKEVAIKSVDIENFEKMANEEEAMLLKLKDSSPYLVNVIECFEEV
jgi:serine/threonine protein kinase